MKKLGYIFLILLGTFFLGSVHAETQTMNQSELSELVSGAAIEGNTGATITLIVYSDMECPFCVRLHNQIGLTKNVIQKYGNQVNFIYKNNRGVNHKNTEKKALTALCIKRIASHDLYNQFYHEVMSASTSRLYPVGRIPSFLRKNDISRAKYNQCMKSDSVMKEFNAETEEAQKYNLYGTPGVLIINIKTLKYDTVQGAYPIETFYEKIDALLK